MAVIGFGDGWYLISDALRRGELVAVVSLL